MDLIYEKIINRIFKKMEKKRKLCTTRKKESRTLQCSFTKE